MTTTNQWTKANRIQRMAKRITQLNHYIDNHIQRDRNYHGDAERHAPPLNHIKAEADLLRKIAEEQGDIPRTTTPEPETKPIDININGINATNI